MLDDLPREKTDTFICVNRILPWIAMQTHAVFGPSAYTLNKELNLVFH